VKLERDDRNEVRGHETRNVRWTRRAAAILALGCALLASPPVAEAAGVTSWSKNSRKSESSGNSDFAAGYTVEGTLGYKHRSIAGKAGDVLTSYASSRAWARVMGEEHRIVELRGDGYVEIGNAAASRFDARLYILGVQTHSSGPFRNKFGPVTKSWEHTFFSASAQFAVGPIPVVATARAKGSLGYTASGDVDAAAGKLAMAFEPTLAAQVLVQAGVGTDGFSVGAYGSLTLLSVSGPVTGSLVKSGTDLAYSEFVLVLVQSLNGEIGLYAECGPFRVEFCIFKWNGLFMVWVPGSSSGRVAVEG